ncbi:hypothetical protein B7P43_G13310 [Cryptotermes secundus]|uniref:C2H2-type domain-containing protein n=1 Tax=Cryptotermes secundus TaxID=105785 RepID=A0A2J7R797_9NEOP|nr:zinc finger and BTB domain-containing protein 14 isoform X3 [Cryptotermes secundus]PNF36704.1 hypothetical protein B7P43_G13310 [Cryptotermes secundus]
MSNGYGEGSGEKLSNSSTYEDKLSLASCFVKDEPSSHSEACPSWSHDGDQAVNIKVEEFSDIEDGEKPVPMTVVGIKAEHEEDVPGSHSEGLASSSHSGAQAINIKVESSDNEDNEDTVPMTVVGIKAEHEDCAYSEEDVPGSCTETCPASSHDAFQAISIKDEVSDVKEEEEDPVPISFPGIEAKHEGVVNKVQVIHSEFPFSCDVCYKSFTRSHGLKRHQRMHAAGRSLFCDVCNKTFRSGGFVSRLEETAGQPQTSCAKKKDEKWSAC